MGSASLLPGPSGRQEVRRTIWQFKASAVWRPFLTTAVEMVWVGQHDRRAESKWGR